MSLVKQSGVDGRSGIRPDRRLTRQVWSAGIATLAHDAAGRRIARDAATGTTAYAWSPRDELLQITPPTGLPVTSTYRHDGLRLERRRGSVVQGMVWDGSDILSIEGADWALYPRRPEIARQVAFASQGSGYAPHVHHPDGQGTMLAVTDAAQATETTYVTDAWGTLVSGSKAFGPFEYLGEPGYYRDPNLTLLYVRQRWLDPEVGAWLSADPVEDELRYAYARNSPTLFTDPSGTLSWRELWERVKRAWSGSTMVSTADPVQPGTVTMITSPLPSWAARVAAAKQRGAAIERLQQQRAQNPTQRELLEEKITNFVQWAVESPVDYLARTFDFDPNALNPAFAYWQRANGFWAYLPPVGYSPGVAQYWVGFLRGASIAIDHQTNGELIAADLYDLCLVLAKEPDAWHMIKAAWELTIKPFHDLNGPPPRSAFERGLQAGMIVVAIVMLILGAISGGKTAVGAIGALMRLPGMAAKLAQRGLAAARSMGGGRGGRGVTAGASGTNPPTGTQSSGVTAAASTSPSAGPGGVQPGGGTGVAAALPETAPVEVPAVDGAAGAASRRPAAASGGADPVEQSLGQVREDLTQANASAQQVPAQQSTWRRPKGWRLPKNGTWTGEPGNSEFVPTNPGSLGIKLGDRIPFQAGIPDFRAWAAEIHKVPGLTGQPKPDSRTVIRFLATQRGTSPTVVEQSLQQRGLRIHHFRDDEIQLVPVKLHTGIRHSGGASILRDPSLVE